MTGLNPEIEPFEHGMLEVGDGNLVYWETCGNPRGKPAIVLHGGPGSGCVPWHRRLFDPSVYRVVLFDQRNCGRSTPHASTPDADLASNTTSNLIADIELLRQRLGVNRWLVFGGSWGSTLALAYAEKYPGRVTEMILFGVTTGRRKEFDWLFRGGVAVFFPEQWERLRTNLPVDDRHVVRVEIDADVLVSLDPGEGVVLSDREDDVVAGQRHRIDHLTALPAVLLEPAQALELHADELPMLDDEARRRVVFHDLDQLFLGVLEFPW